MPKTDLFTPQPGAELIYKLQSRVVILEVEEQAVMQ